MGFFAQPCDDKYSVYISGRHVEGDPGIKAARAVLQKINCDYNNESAIGGRVQTSHTIGLSLEPH